ncbi:MAG: hypothetical protein M1276_05385 [Deltaproteobacteria bacterium]|jgi:peptidoglycan hydrolase CwlO-like protein|nr:hypothetical protein [Deltaproteobacteria bacterium]
MSAQENLKENALRKVIQELIVPDLNKIRTDVSLLNEKLNGLDSKVESFRNEFKSELSRLDGRIDSLDDKIEIRLNSLDEKINLMNKFNEKLFEAVFHKEIK